MYGNIEKTSFFACFGHLLLDNHGLMVINEDEDEDNIVVRQCLMNKREHGFNLSC